MNNEKLIASIAEFAASKNIDRPTVIHMLRDVLQALIEKKFGPGNDFDIVIDPKKGDLQIWRTRIIVADDDRTSEAHNKIKLSEAKKIEVDFEVGEEVVEEVGLEMFGRRAVMDALQLFMRKKDVLTKEQFYKQYERRMGKLVVAEVGYSKPSITILYDDDKNELLLPKEEQIPGERFRKGSYIKGIIAQVDKLKGRVSIVVSRTSPLFLKELLTLEIPEIFDNIVLIKGIARMPGVRSKVIVESQDDRIDAAGACIGRNARRIQSISKEQLNNERVDIITYTSNLNLFIKRIAGLGVGVEAEEEEEEVVVRAKGDQMPVLHQNLPFLKQILNKEVRIVTIDGTKPAAYQLAGK